MIFMQVSGHGTHGTSPDLARWLEDRDLLGLRVVIAQEWEDMGMGALFDLTYQIHEHEELH